jgi:hypothetical protein
VRGTLISALLVLALYGSYHFNVIGFELTSNNAAPDSKAPVVSGIASSKVAASTPIIEVPATKTPLPVTATPAPESTATPEATPTTVATATPEPEDEDVDDTADEEDEDSVELTALAPEPTSTPEPTPEPTSTPVPTAEPATPTATVVPPTATVAVAIGVVVTPVGGSAAATPTATPPATALRAAGPVASVGPGPWTGDATPFHSSLAGNTMGCGEVFNPLDPTILAVGYALDTTVPCGASLQVCGSTSVCLTMVRKDTCPGCPGTDVDLSRAAFDRICGTTASRCTVTIKKL